LISIAVVLHENGDDINVLVDGSLYQTLSCKIYSKRFSLPSNFPSQESFEQYLEEKQLNAVRSWLARYLGMKNCPSHEVHAILEKNHIDHLLAKRVIDEFIAKGYIDDNEWIRSFIRVQTQKKRGPQEVRRKLMQKGFTDEQIAPFLQESENVQFEQIRLLLETKFQKRNMNDFKEKNKTIAALQRRGFDLQTILEVINQ